MLERRTLNKQNWWNAYIYSTEYALAPSTDTSHKFVGILIVYPMLVVHCFICAKITVSINFSINAHAQDRSKQFIYNFVYRLYITQPPIVGETLIPTWLAIN